jgi:hypothetical protein
LIRFLHDDLDRAGVKVPTTSSVAPSSGKKSKTHPSKPYDIIQGMERVIDMMANELSAQRKTRRTARPSHSIFVPPAMCASNVSQSRSRSNLGDSNRLATSRSNLTPVVTPSTYRASTIRVHNTHSVAVGYGGISIRSAASHASRRLPRLRTAASFRRPGSASCPIAKDPPSSASWWSQRTTHRGLARRILRRRVGSKPMRTVHRGGWRSNARRHLHVPATYVSCLKRRGYQHSTTPRPT